MRLRQAYFHHFGVAPPAKSMHSDEWRECNPDAFQIHPLDRCTITHEPRRIFGQTEEIEEHQRLLTPELAEVDRQHIFGRRTISVDAAMLELPNARTGFSGSSVVTEDGTLLQDLGATRFSQTPRLAPFLHIGNVPKPRKLSGSIGVLSRFQSGRNFYHMLAECIPRLRVFEQLGIEPDFYYAPFSQRKFCRELLELFGLRSDRVIEEGRYAHVQAKQLFTPIHDQHLTPAAAAYMFEKMASQPWAKVGASNKRIYISRSQRAVRHVVNEAELVRTLKRHGFTCYHLETMSIREQVELFQQAEIIIGPHGAGLSNAVFSVPGTPVIELATVYRPFPFFPDLCHAAGHPFFWYLGNAVDGQVDEQESNIHVDPAKFESFLIEQVLPAKSELQAA